MIKLIVSDMDGTLLSHDKQLPSDFFEVFDKLRRKGIVFAAASGRTYLTLLQHFSEIATDMHFISDNGTNLYMNNKCVHRLSMADEAWRRIAVVCENRDGVAAVVNGVNGDYVLPFRHDKDLEKIIDGGFAALTEVDNMQSVDDCVYKIGICDKSGPHTGLFDDICAVCGEDIEAVISGPVYMDVMAKGANKGSALKILQQKLNILPEETMTFGDYFNDIGLFENSFYSYAMQNAPAEVQFHAKNIAKSNDEQGVISVIRELVLA